MGRPGLRPGTPPSRASERAAVPIGSTQKIGVGTNIQARAAALHHLDCPWRPADIEQREGRILRQGNQNEAVGIYRYVVAGSFDGYSWQTVERKARFIGQIMRGSPDARTLDDLGDDTLSYAEVKALASGNPLLIDKAAADAELQRLERLERAHGRQLTTLRHTRKLALQDELSLNRRADVLEDSAARATPTAGDAFTCTISGTRYDKRADAAQALSELVSDALARRIDGTGPLGEVAQLAGFTITADAKKYADGRVIAFAIDGVPIPDTTTDVNGGRINAAGALRSLETKLATLDQAAARARRDAAAHRETADRAAEQLDRPFKHASALTEAGEVADDLDRQLQAQAEPPEPERPWAEAQRRLVDTIAEHQQATAALDRLPVRELTRLRAAEERHTQLTEQRGPLAQRAADPAAPRHHRVLLDHHDEQLARAGDHVKRLRYDLHMQTRGADPGDLRRQVDDAAGRRDRAADQRKTLTREIVEHAQREPPAWITEQIGTHPGRPETSEAWRTAITAAVTGHLQLDPARPLEHGPAAPTTPRARQIHACITDALTNNQPSQGRSR